MLQIGLHSLSPASANQYLSDGTVENGFLEVAETDWGEVMKETYVGYDEGMTIIIKYLSSRNIPIKTWIQSYIVYVQLN